MRILLGLVLALSVSFSQTEQKHIDVVVKSMSMSNFCKVQTIMCATDRPSDKKYNGMQGRLFLDPVTQEYGREIYKIKMSNGDFLFYANTKGDFFDRSSGLIELSAHLKILDAAGKPIIENGQVLVDKVALDDRGIGYKYHLSTGKEVWGDTFKELKAFLPYIPKEHEESFIGIIDDIKITHDNIEDKFFISIEESFDDILYDNNLVITPYVGFQDGKPFLRFKFNYIAKNWLFINKALVKADDFKKNFEDLSFERDHSSSTIWEWYDKPATEEDIQLIKNIIESDEAVVRFYGKQYYKDRNITLKQKQKLKNILWIYEILQ